MTDFEERVKDWETRIEGVLVEMVQEKTSDGRHVVFNSRPIAEAFIKAVEEMRLSHASEAYITIPDARWYKQERSTA